MKITEKIQMNLQGLIENGPVTIVAFGDSVTHGAVAAGEINYETVYHNRLKRMLNAYRNYVPVNVINAGIGGITAIKSLGRMDAQVLAHHPDLVIVCFGLNDVNGPLEAYTDSLREIFARCKAAGADVIFLTPNMLNTYASPLTEERYKEYAVKTAEMQNSGRMDQYMDAAREVARAMDVPVADAYARWKELSKTEDTTAMLANYINHPTKEMHVLFAEELWKTIFEGTDIPVPQTEDTMYKA